MAIDPQDKLFLEAAEDALSAAWRRYHAAPDSEKPLLQPQVRLAYQSWLEIRMKLLEPATLSTSQDVADAQQLKSDIDAAADSQALLLALAKLVALLAQFA
jgi:hypothetical protein